MNIDGENEMSILHHSHARAQATTLAILVVIIAVIYQVRERAAAAAPWCLNSPACASAHQRERVVFVALPARPTSRSPRHTVRRVSPSRPAEVRRVVGDGGGHRPASARCIRTQGQRGEGGRVHRPLLRECVHTCVAARDGRSSSHHNRAPLCPCARVASSARGRELPNVSVRAVRRGLLPAAFSHSPRVAESVEERKANSKSLVNHYYDLVTSFYECVDHGRDVGTRLRCRTRRPHVRRSYCHPQVRLGRLLPLCTALPGRDLPRVHHPSRARPRLPPGPQRECSHQLLPRNRMAASALPLFPATLFVTRQSDMFVLDVGCGVGGPARNICRFTGAAVTGLNNNQFQVERATIKARNEHLYPRVAFVKGDFMAMPFEDGAFDAAFAIEATCHAPDRIGVFSEVFRSLKPGGLFGS